jgi:hypothetical protein
MINALAVLEDGDFRFKADLLRNRIEVSSSDKQAQEIIREEGGKPVQQ